MKQRSQFLVLAAAAALPFLLLSAAMAGLFESERKAALTNELHSHAADAARAVDAEVGHVASELDALAILSDMPGSRHTFAMAADRLLRHHADWRGIAMVSAAPPFQPLAGFGQAPHPSPDLWAAAAASGRPAAGYDSETGEPTIAVIVPILHAGKVDRLLAASVSSSRLDRALAEEGAPRSWLLVALDQSRTIVGRSRDGDRFTGTEATPSMSKAASGSRQGLEYTTTKDGERIYTAFGEAPLTGWTLAVGAPASAIEGPLRRMMMWIGGGTAAAIALAVALISFALRTIAAREQAERLLLSSAARQSAEQRISDIAANIPGIVYRRALKPDGTISHPFVSDGVPDLARMIRGDGHGGPPRTLDEFGKGWMPDDDRKRWAEAARHSAEALTPLAFEGRIRVNDHELWFRSCARSHRGDDGTIFWDGVMLDITDQKNAEHQLQAALTERETLLREIHHRVKNNLQVVSSLVQIEAFRITDPAIQARLAVIDHRVAVLGRIHEQFYRSEDLSRVDFGSFASMLGQNLAELHGAGDRVTLTADCETLATDIDTAVPLGLLANELISNAFKHAFPGGRSGTVTIGLRRRDDRVEFEVADDGIGLPEPSAVRSGSIGLELITALAGQVGGKVTTTSGSGTRTVVSLDGAHFQTLSPPSPPSADAL
jgi:two-component sensor histidine kinase/PAS domain-containing protein